MKQIPPYHNRLFSPGILKLFNQQKGLEKPGMVKRQALQLTDGASSGTNHI